ncbi:MAG: ribose ABC transporter ATP-binding protein RbsA [Calditrichia bacterium]
MLEFQNISKSFSGVEVLHQVSFSVDEGIILALVGENGAGKSTLMKILSGIITDYEGTILINKKPVRLKNPREAEKAGVSIIHQELNLVPHLSVGENIFLGKEPVGRLGKVDFKKIYRESDELLKEFDFPYSSRLKIRNLAVGWQQMVEIAKALRVNASIIIMDEPTSALSAHEISVLFDKMRKLKSLGKTVIFISHRLKEVLDIADEIAILRDGYFVGKYPRNEISREQLISLMIGHEISEEIIPNESVRDEEILALKNLEVIRKDSPVLSEINFSLKKGEVLGIAGLLGAGRTELLKFLYGEFPGRYRGSIRFRGEPYVPRSATDSISNKIVYLSEDRKTEGIFPDAGLQFNSSISVLPWFSRLGVVNARREREAVIEKFRELNVRMKSLNQKIPTLSGGNQQKVLLSRVLLLHPVLLLLDEPTRGIDVGAKEEIYDLVHKLSQQGAAILVTSSEIPELIRMAHRILVLSRGKQTAILNASETNPQEILHHAFKQV